MRPLGTGWVGMTCKAHSGSRVIGYSHSRPPSRLVVYMASYTTPAREADLSKLRWCLADIIHWAVVLKPNIPSRSVVQTERRLHQVSQGKPGLPVVYWFERPEGTASGRSGVYKPPLIQTPSRHIRTVLTTFLTSFIQPRSTRPANMVRLRFHCITSAHVRYPYPYTTGT